MKLGDLTKALLKLESEHGSSIKVFYRHSSSGDCGEIWGGHITNVTDFAGPFDIERGEFYISLNIGGN